MYTVIVDRLSSDDIALKNMCQIYTTDKTIVCQSILYESKIYSSEIIYLNSLSNYVPNNDLVRDGINKNREIHGILRCSSMMRTEHNLELGKSIIVIVNNTLVPELKDVIYQGDSDEYSLILKTGLNGTIINENTFVAAKNMQNQMKRIKIIKCDSPYGLVTKKTEFHLVNSKKALKIDSISFETLDVGGLSDQFEEIFTKVFLSRIISPTLHQKLGVQHVKGIIMHGPPGCGKTRMARSIAQILDCKNIQIINGPELLDKYVGGSEEKVRKLFAGAEKNPNELYVIIFDEFDSLVRTRGSGGSSSNVGDSVVTQLLSKIDGVNSLNNIILFGLTNRLDIIDEAILRPGRFEVHIKVGLPDEKGRKEIFKIHMKEPIKNNSIDPDVDIDELAALTENFTGAEIESVVKSAISSCMRSQIDMNKISESATKIKNIVVSREYFIHAIKSCEPLFGLTENLGDQLKSRIYITNPETEKSLYDMINTAERSLIIGISGKPRSGKTSLACSVTSKFLSQKKFKYIRYLNAGSFLNKRDNQKINILMRTLTEGQNGLIILDNIESILEYVPPNRFDNNIFHLLKTIFYETKNHIIITSVKTPDLEYLGFFESVDHWIML